MSNTIISQVQSPFQRSLNQTLYVFSQKRERYNISDMIFIRAPGSFPRGGTSGYRGVLGRSIISPKFNQILCVNYLHE